MSYTTNLEFKHNRLVQIILFCIKWNHLKRRLPKISLSVAIALYSKPHVLGYRYFGYRFFMCTFQTHNIQRKCLEINVKIRYCV